MIDLHYLANQWAISFALGLAGLIFLTKLFVHRRMTPIDFLGGIAELPSDISAACLSLAAAYLWLKDSDTHIGSLAFLFLGGSFLVTTASYRYIDDIKSEVLEKPIRIFAVLVLSYFCLYQLSLSIISQVYAGVSS